ncbi:MAG: hypothetical protein MJ087_07895 [Lachnospiraceae bacterium]|nr:hypothetical protein [Lachnospiraceae bacterium]
MAQHISKIETNWTDTLGKKVVHVMQSLNDQNREDCEKAKLILENRDAIRTYCEAIISSDDDSIY